MLRFFLLALLLWLAGVLPAQDTLRVMSYNLLNFPDPNPAGKVDTLAGILAWHPVDLLICEEVHDASGAQLVLNQALNVNGTDRFSMATFVPQQSAPWATVKLAQIIYYDHNMLGLRDQALLYTDVRDINVYTLFLRDNGISQGDTTFLTVYAVHLKASNSPQDVADRLEMAQILYAHMATLPPDRQVLVAGDMNVYTGSEPAFTTLLAPAGNIQLVDPLDFGGISWSSGVNAEIFTQSTRISTVFGDGAGGGLDDRFDIVLISDDISDNSASIHLVPGSYKALGNSGTCWNDNVTDCGTWQTPYDILRKLYYMSDHLPITLQLATDAVLGAELSLQAPVPLSARLIGRGIAIEGADGRVSVRLFDVLGRSVFGTVTTATGAGTSIQLPEGLYGPLLARVTSGDRAVGLRFVLE